MKRKKKPWYFWLIFWCIMGIISYVLTTAAILTPFVTIGVIEDRKSDENINSVFQKFDNVESSNDYYCSNLTYPYCVSYNKSYFNINYQHSLEEETTIPSSYLPYDDLIFLECVYSTKDDVFSLYYLKNKEKEFYLLFKTPWDQNKKTEFVASLDISTYYHKYVSPHYDEDEAGFYFWFRSEKNKYILYNFDVKESRFIELQTLNESISYYDSHLVEIKEPKTNNKEFLLPCDNGDYVTSFKKTCGEAFDLTINNSFKPKSVYRIDNCFLCIYRRSFSLAQQTCVLSVFSYDLVTKIESFQGLYIQKYNGRYAFYRAF